MIYRLKVRGPEAWELLYPMVDSLLYAEDEADTHYIWVDTSSEPIHPIILAAELRDLPTYDWDQQWQEHAPGFHDGYVPLEVGGKTLRLLPGPGFGDLSHPTTQLVLDMMPEVVKGKDVLDVGCGSGVLSVAAAACGAKSVWAIDIDPLAEDHTRLNAENNDFAVEVGTLPGTDALVVLINMILSEQEVAMQSLDAIRGQIESVVCSGALSTEKERLEKLWPDFKAVRFQTKGDWLGAYLVKR